MKRNAIGLELKKKIIDAADSGLKNKELSAKFNLANSTISEIIKAKHKIFTAIENGGSAKRSKIRKDSSLDEALLAWLKIQRSNNIPINGPLLKVCFLKFV